MNTLGIKLGAAIILFIHPLNQASAQIINSPPLFQGESQTPGDIEHIVATALSKPLPIFSHATVYQGLVHVSCIQGFLPGTMEFPGDAKTQAEQVLKNLKQVLEQSGSSLDRVLKLTIFFRNLKDDFAAVNEVINRYFPKNPPARSSIGVAELPRDAKVVMECSAAIKL